MQSEIRSSVKDFFEGYRVAFERLDAGAIADHFAYPGHVTSDSDQYGIGLLPVAEKQQWIGTLQRLLGMYGAVGFASARIRKLATTELSAGLVQAIVHWALHDRAGRLLYEFEAAYTLAKLTGAFRITALAHNEIPQYRACVARLQSASA